MTRPRQPVAVALLWLACVALAPALSRLPPAAERALESVSASALRTHVSILASDDMQGRAIGQLGNRRAETYAARALEAAGLSPAVEGSFLHRVDLYQPAIDKDAGRLILRDREGRALADLRIGRDFQPLIVSSGTPVEARVVFAGHGISAPHLRHDDYARIDARGAIVMALDEAPTSLMRRAKAQDAAALVSVERKIADAVTRGAIGLLVVRKYLPDVRAVFPEPSSGPFASYRLYAEFRDARVTAGAMSADAAAPIREALARGAVVTASLRPGLVAEPIPTHNVIGLVEGRDPANREMVVVGAHLDHEGVGSDGHVYNGADDNASGTAAVIEMAAAFARAAREGHRPARATVFALWNAEERGSLGADGYVMDPHPRRKIIANINLDMVGRGEVVDPNDPRFRGFPRRTSGESRNMLHVLGYSYAPELARTLAEANAAIGLELRQEYDREAQNLLQRSDNWAFLRRGIPALFLTTGLHPDYHTPNDDTERIDFDKLERITELAGRTAWLVADR